MAIEILAEPGVIRVFGLRKAVEIEMKDGTQREFIRFDQGVTWAAHAPSVAKGAQQGSHQGRLAAAKGTVEGDQHARMHQGRQCPAEGIGGLGIGKMALHCAGFWQ